MKHTAAWRVVVSVGITVAMALSGWCLNAVANMPKEYVLKDDFQTIRKENKDDHKAIMDAILDLYKEIKGD